MSPSRPKVLLYNPQAVYHTMPLALVAVGSNLDRSRYDVEVIDARADERAQQRVLDAVDDALCFGVSVLTGAPLRDALAMSRRVKVKRPDLPVIWGGWHPSLFPLQTLDEPAVDVTVVGQGEVTFAELVERLASSGETTVESLAGLPGICYRADGEPAQNPPRALRSMDEFPRADFDLVDVERFFALKGRRQLDFITSIGCPFRCAFCADPFVYQRGWKCLSPERVGKELEALDRRYHLEDVNFQDETFFVYPQRVMEIAEQLLSRHLGFSWAATMRADQAVRMPEEAFELCVRSGMRRLLIGVESGSPEMLERIKKDTTLEQVVAAAELCRRHQVAVIFSFIVGFPRESDAELQATLAMVKRLRSMSPAFETPIFYYKPYPGSELARDVPGDTPQTLEEWGDFDYVAGAAGAWVKPESRRLVDRFKFYNRFAWGRESWLRFPLQRLSRWRCRHDLYGLPLEKAVVDRLWPGPTLS